MRFHSYWSEFLFIRVNLFCLTPDLTRSQYDFSSQNDCWLKLVGINKCSIDLIEV